ncbi:unnamed protein product [Microthlaspi erraticum]|uniref:Reverse transcriptase domain-containing protein n=1 Tax=Microthlaspi erraticum TaxID=1685480 RepID=A0A6D2JAR6_9BRAS|nr:unnamed protein product [Microthlaspi erraticum]
MKDYRPISCCNVLYKVISKIIANRLKKILPDLISLNQSAFIKDRLLVENLLLATELVKDYHKHSISSRCAINIDISKAFDSVQWSFLLNTLSAMNLPATFIHWISLCITTATFSVQVNGELAGFFRSARGLRQGRSLSPYLFILSMNVLSKILDKAASDRVIGYHPRCQNVGLTHLSFADDIMVLTDGKIRSVDGIIKVFDDFAKMLGLKISLEKSTIFLAGVSNQIKEDMALCFPFTVGQLPAHYLGLPLLTKCMSSHDYLPLIERIRKKITSWTARFLSFAGRLQHIASVIQSLTNFWLSAFRLPSECLKEIERLCSAFLWSGPTLSSHKAKISWSEVCKPKREGGLGLRPLKEVNAVSCLKMAWRILSSTNSLWVNWIKAYLIRQDSFWTVQLSTNMGSWMWRKILKYRDKAKRFFKMDVRNRGSGSSNENDKKTAPSFRHFKLNRNATQCIPSLWETGTENSWHRGIWFRHSTPKYAFCVWLAIHNRLSTLDRMQMWNTGIITTCTLCHTPSETRDHLFFSCRYSAEVWGALSKGLLKRRYTTDWTSLISFILDTDQDSITLLLARYVFQTTTHGIWGERKFPTPWRDPNPSEPADPSYRQERSKPYSNHQKHG